MSDEHKCPAWFHRVIAKPVVNRAQGTISAELCCPADFPAFAGHFPGQPVLPAVMQLVVVRLLAGELLQRPLDPIKTDRLKFKGMIQPNETINVQVHLEKVAGDWHAAFKLRRIDAVVSAGTILFKAG